MFTKENTVILIGKSPILNNKDIVNKIQECKIRFHSIGINHAAVLFNTEYFAFVDHNLKYHFENIHPNTKIITSDRNITDKFKGDFYELYFAKDDDPPFQQNKYAYRGFTHDICLSWACMKGFENVILFGVADFSNDNKYLDKYHINLKSLRFFIFSPLEEQLHFAFPTYF